MNLILTYIKQNKVVDAINIRTHAMCAKTISMCKSNMKNRVLQALISYEYYLEVNERLQKKMHIIIMNIIS